jgi:hypothetical protein
MPEGAAFSLTRGHQGDCGKEAWSVIRKGAGVHLKTDK